MRNVHKLQVCFHGLQRSVRHVYALEAQQFGNTQLIPDLIPQHVLCTHVDSPTETAIYFSITTFGGGAYGKRNE